MNTTYCPTCHQPLHSMRAGIQLTPLKARIFDAVKRAGDVGISNRDIARIAFDGRASADTVKQHIFQINSLLCETDFSIKSVLGHYVIVENPAASEWSPKKGMLAR
jgi:hypothetical protein